MTHLINQLISYKAVYRTAPATPGLLIQSVGQPFPPTALQRRHTQTVRDSFFSYNTYYFIVIKKFLIPEGHQNPISAVVQKLRPFH